MPRPLPKTCFAATAIEASVVGGGAAAATSTVTAAQTVQPLTPTPTAAAAAPLAAWLATDGIDELTARGELRDRRCTPLQQRQPLGGASFAGGVGVPGGDTLTGGFSSSPQAHSDTACSLAPASYDDEPTTGEFYRLRHVLVYQLLEDGTLGLLLHGTNVVGFCGAGAEDTGWAVGDQIVEINGHPVAVFDEFLEQFKAAQEEEGFPITFSVLRREVTVGPDDVAAEDALDSFFGATDLGELAGQLHRKFGASSPPIEEWSPVSGVLGSEPTDDGEGYLPRCESITENPYIQALRNRRDELKRSAEGWSGEEGDLGSLPARLATQRTDGLAMLQQLRTTPRNNLATNLAGPKHHGRSSSDHTGQVWPGKCFVGGVGARCSSTTCVSASGGGEGNGALLLGGVVPLPCTGGGGTSRVEGPVPYEFRPTPRVDSEEAAFACSIPTR